MTKIRKTSTLALHTASTEMFIPDRQKTGQPEVPINREFLELQTIYNKLITNRSIPYPIAYQFIKELGHGRQGVVFLATRYGARSCLTHHAVKLFNPGIYSSPAKYWTDMERIAKQISVLQPINNSNLISMDFYDECNNIGYMLMQTVDGVDLQYLLDRRHIEIARARSTPDEWNYFTTALFKVEADCVSLHAGAALYILRNVLRGLAILHDKGFIHGDVKPTNIMIDSEGTIKLVDFGRAARIGEQVNILLGSPLYMSPEIHRREPGLIQSDIFSVGLVALEMFKGHQVADLSNLNENALLDFKLTIAARIEEWFPEDVLNNIEFTRVLKQLLEPATVDRYSSAREAESGEHSLASARQWLADFERETEYERELEAYLAKLVDPETGTLNPHFASDNLTAVIIP